MESKAVAVEKKVQLASSGGAALAGAGIGSLISSWLAPAAVAVAVLGLLLHGWSMLARHQAERRAGVALPWWSTVLFWACWVILSGLTLWLVSGHP